MAGCSGGLLSVLTGTLLLLLLGSVWGWEQINETQLLSLYRAGQWVETLHGSPPEKRGDARTAGRIDDGGFLDNGFLEEDDDDDEDDDAEDDDILTEDLDTETRVGPSVPSFDSVGESEFEVVEENPDLPTWPGSSESDFQVELEDSYTRSWPGSKTLDTKAIDVVCRRNGFQITLSEIFLKDVNILGSKGLQPLMEAPELCGYVVDPDKNTFTVPFKGCHVKESPTDHSLQLLFFDSSGEAQISTVSCGLDPGVPSPEGEVGPRCCGPHTKPTPPKAHNCAVPMAERLTCGPPGMSFSDCDKRGCCMDMSTYSCYYPIDECTVDQNFVFAIRSSSAAIPVNPKQLVVPGHPNCKPLIVNEDVAIFKFSVHECGTRAYEVGQMKIYLAEVQTIVKALNLKYGIITRSDPLRFLVECRYSKCGTAKQSLASVGYMVKTPTSSLPSSILSDGLYGVQLRIARDHTYSSYFPSYHRPLKLLLGKPVFLELLLKSPKPDAVLLVNYCLAYPRSAKNALVLIFEGCANPNDPYVSILKVSDHSKNRHRRRFKVLVFQFMDKRTNQYLDEEIYFMCSTEVCRPTEKTCEERCFDGQVPARI